MTLGERIKKRRIELGLSQEELAHRLGNKSRASVSTVEHDKEDLTTDRIRKYAEALETSPAFLMGWRTESSEMRQTSQETCSLSEQEQRDAFELYQRYKRAIPEIQEAVERLLTSSRSHTPS